MARPFYCFFPAGASGSTATSEKTAVSVASALWEQTANPTSTRLPNATWVWPSSFSSGAVPADRKSDRRALPHHFQLVLRRAVERKVQGVGDITPGVAPLHRRHAVAVNHQVDVRGIRVEGLPQHDPRLAMLHAFAQKSHGGRDGDIARHLAPDVLKLVFLGPDVGAGAGNPVLPGGGVEPGRALEAGPPTSPELVNTPSLPVWANAKTASRPVTQAMFLRMPSKL